MGNSFREQVFRSASRLGRVDLGLRSYMCKVYNYMGLGLGLTGTVSFIVASSPPLQILFLQSPLLWVVTFATIGIACFFGFSIERISFSTAQLLFWGYAALMGISLSSILILYTGESVARIFFVTAATFGAMSLFGYTTQRDLTDFGSFLVMGFLGVFAASLVNLFVGSSALQFALSVMTVLIFTGLTAYDTQRIRSEYREGPAEVQNKQALFSALQLYLNFVNIFVSLIRLFGDRR